MEGAGRSPEDRSEVKEKLTLLSSGAFGAPLPGEGGSGTSSYSNGDTKGNPVTFSRPL